MACEPHRGCEPARTRARRSTGCFGRSMWVELEPHLDHRLPGLLEGIELGAETMIEEQHRLVERVGVRPHACHASCAQSITRVANELLAHVDPMLPDEVGTQVLGLHGQTHDLT